MPSAYNKYLRVPFLPGGRDFNGCDCWGLVRLVCRLEGGIELPDWRIACTSARLIDEQVQFERPNWIKLPCPQELCVVAMRNDAVNPRLINHFGVYVGNHRMLHITHDYKTARRTRIDDPLWTHNIEGCYVPAR